MQFVVKRDTLLRSLNFVQGIVEKKNTLPIVEYYREKGILTEINGMLKIEEVSQQILKIIN